VSIAGGKTFQQIKKAIKEVLRFLQNNYYNVKLINFKVNNICGYTTIKPINLTLLGKYYPDCSYESELFPAVKISYMKVIFTIHHTGKIFATGFKSINELKSIFKNLIKYIDIAL
jgi:TATA-box binding protein (TBP) (component of TFIID and TFIIIB)